MGINFESNTDEYDPEAGTILPRLSSCETEVDLLAVVHEEFTRWFGDSAGSICRYRDAASEIWRIWTDARMKL
ncbi:MAG: hypothetical protein LLG00_10935 [Planctomycetaceae bacterium]|nr:hypothetical protein [Planctomycetaceae bacterium]